LPPPRPKVTGKEPGMLWLPDPVCEWLPTTEANAEIEKLGMTIQTPRVVSTRLLRAPEAPLEPVLLPEVDRGPRPGRIVVSTSDHDHVRVGDADVIVEDGAAVGRAPQGMAWVTITGGGRLLRLPVFAVDDNAIWLPIDPPVSRRIPFRSGRSSLAREALDLVQRLATLRGDWSYHIQGSYSVEGNLDANTRLAEQRAASVRDALLAAGVPEEAIVIVPVQPPDPRLPVDDQRSAVVIPVEVP
ncbi:MAG: hypothetical protein KC656_03515, partial [Myxococcales bacterium]|nr:hypothetical protein [Myxococcales bacterium]